MSWNPHVTVAAVIEKNNKFLFVEEKVDGLLVINQPAGHWEAGESLTEAASRETMEETGWEFHPTHLVGVYRWDHPKKAETFLRFTFCGTCSEEQVSQNLDDGIEAATWHEAEIVLSLPEEKIRSTMVTESLKDYIAGKRYELDIIKNIFQDW